MQDIKILKYTLIDDRPLLVRSTILTYLKNKGYNSLTLEEIIIKKEAKGRPILILRKIKEKLSISISHTDNLLAIGISSKGLTGIDIENIQEFKKSVYNNFTTDKEKVWISSLPKNKKNSHITLLWSLKEAYLKAMGTGLRVHPKELQIVPNNKGKFEIWYKNIKQPISTWYNINSTKSYVLTKVIL